VNCATFSEHLLTIYYEAENYLCIYNYKLSEYSKTDANDNTRKKVAKEIEDTGIYYFYLFIIVPTDNHVIHTKVHFIILE
jgi:hypothetical protein